MNIYRRNEQGFFLRIAEESSAFARGAERQGIKLIACYQGVERTREKLQKALGEYYNIRVKFLFITPNVKIFPE